MFDYFPNSLLRLWKNLRQNPKKLPLVIILVTVILIITFKFLQPQPPVKPREEKTWIVEIHRLNDGPKSPQLALYGRVESPYTATLTSSLSADISSLDTKEGKKVVAGQLLVTFDSADAQLALDEKKANIAELNAQIESEKNRYQNDLKALKIEKSLLSLAEKKLAREAKTSKNKLTSQSSYDSQKQALENQKLALSTRQLSVKDHPARLAQLEAKLARNQALMQQAMIDLQRTEIKAPFDGIILKTMAIPGEHVRPGEALIDIFASDEIEVRAQLPEKYIMTVKQAIADHVPLHATIENTDGRWTVTLSRVSATIDSNSNGVDALFTVNHNTARYLTIGDTVKLQLELPAIEDVFRVPVSSIYGGDRIYRVTDGRLSMIKVEKLGNQYQDNRQFVLVRNAALHAGDEIITTQLPHAVSGLKVTIKRSTIPGSSASQDAPVSQAGNIQAR